MLGSTRWVTQNLQNLRKSVFAMVYVDSIRGALFGGSVMPGLRGALDEVLTKVHDPGTGKLVMDLHSQYEMPGFSSDTIPFTGLAGIPVAQLTYGTNYPMYHSIYDDLEWMGKFGDPGYRNSAAMTRILALYLFRLSAGPIFPFRFDEMSSEVVQVLTRLQLDRPDLMKFPSFPKLLEEVQSFQEAANRFHQTVRNNHEIANDQTAKVNLILLDAVQSFTASEGSFILRNMLVGPSSENLCSGAGLSALQTALNSATSRETQTQLERLIQGFARARSLLLEAEKLLH